MMSVRAGSTSQWLLVEQKPKVEDVILAQEVKA
jgi:hypothetical protein